MKISFISSALAVAVLGLAMTPGDAAAADFTKTYAGSGCKVFGSTAWTDLQFGARGITNLTNVPKNIICPIIKDSEASWDSSATSAASMHYHMQTGNNALTTTCNVYVVDDHGNLLNTYSSTVGGSPATEYFDTLSGFDGNARPFGDHQQATMLCTLAAGARLNYYTIQERDPTD